MPFSSEKLRAAGQDFKNKVELHCPPLYSAEATQRAFMNGVMAGRQEGLHKGVKIAEEVIRHHGIAVDVRVVSSGAVEVNTYQGADGTPIKDELSKLLTALGFGLPTNPEEGDETQTKLIIRLGVILGHAEKRALDKSELEYLRNGRALIQLLGISPSELCDNGQEMVTKMDELIAQDLTNNNTPS